MSAFHVVITPKGSRKLSNTFPMSCTEIKNRQLLRIVSNAGSRGITTQALGQKGRSVLGDRSEDVEGRGLRLVRNGFLRRRDRD